MIKNTVIHVHKCEQNVFVHTCIVVHTVESTDWLNQQHIIALTHTQFYRASTHTQ